MCSPENSNHVNAFHSASLKLHSRKDEFYNETMRLTDMSCSRPRRGKKNAKSSSPKSNSLTADYIEEPLGQELLVSTAHAIWCKKRKS